MRDVRQSVVNLVLLQFGDYVGNIAKRDLEALPLMFYIKFNYLY